MCMELITKKGGEIMLRKKGFTLIELLIVVAIIAILAAIAIPNFLEAQVRSKVSRAKADLRSIATGLETYCIDNRHYIPDGYLGIPPGSDNGYINYMLSTPLAYISNANWYDPFVDQKTGNAFRKYRYYNIKWRYLEKANLPDYDSMYEDILGAWVLYSDGPDKTLGPFSENTKYGPLWACTTLYDPTNGTTSLGDIIRCAKSSDKPNYF